MTDMWAECRKRIAKKLKASADEIEEPEQEGFGDFAYPCFSLARKMKKAPQQIAASLAAKIRIKGIRETKALGPYVNFYVDWEDLGKGVLKSVNKKYGTSRGKGTFIMDVFQANPFKAFHIGHVRNAVLGESIRRLLLFTGRKAIAVSYNGDVGLHVAKWLWYYQKFYKGGIPKVNFSKWAGKIYAKACKKMEEKDEYKDEVNELNRGIDQRSKKIMGKWRRMRDLCYKDFLKIKNELGIHLDAPLEKFAESNCEGPGKRTVEKFLRQGKLKKSQGAIVIDLEKHGLGVFVLLKSDGTALYSTKDIGLLHLKKKYRKFDKMIYVVATEQDFYFRQLFKTFDVLKLYPEKNSIHVSYGLVTLKEGKMASRLGNVILYEDLRDETIKRVLEEINKRNPDLEDKERTAKDIALGAIKFSMLSVENSRPIKFDWDQALDFEGKSGPYLQYTHARASSILRRKKPGKSDAALLKEKSETRLLKKIASFPMAVKKSADDYSPHILANYLFELAQDFNSFYNELPVLKAGPEKLMNARLRLVKATRTVLRTGLELLGIEPLDRM